jgi:hypothetical protein
MSGQQFQNDGSDMGNGGASTGAVRALW